MTEQPFTGHVRSMRADADWFGAEDLLDLGDVPFQIVAICFDPDLKIAGNKSKDRHYLKLADKHGRECHKKMLINSHRRKMLGKLYGGAVTAWVGKWAWVYVDTVKSPQGGTTLGMRFRDRTDAPKVDRQDRNEAGEPA